MLWKPICLSRRKYTGKVCICNNYGKKSNDCYSAPQVVIWREYAGRLIIPKGFSNPPGLYRQD